MGSKEIAIDKAVSLLKSGDTVLFGGFLGVGTPEAIIDAIVKTDIKDLTIIGTTTAFPDKGVGKLIVAKKVKKAIVSHIGTNPESVRQMNAGELEVEFSPLGSLVERVRAGGFGLGGVLTPTGIGTLAQNGKEIINVKGKDYLLETPLRADIAFIKADIADTNGNLLCRKAARNFNTIMPFASDICVAEVGKIVGEGELDPDIIHVPYIVVSYLVKS